jgi:hypothetical protein
MIQNVELHGLEETYDIRENIEKDCTSNYPDVFYTREQYFLDLPYRENYYCKPQKAYDNIMSPYETKY